MKNILKCLCAIIFLLQTQSSFSQQLDSARLLEIYNTETIYIDGNSSKFIKNGEKFRVGNLGKKLREHVAESPAALHEMKLFRRQTLGGTTLMIVGTIPIIASLMAPQITIPMQVAVLAGGTIVYMAGTYNLVNARLHLNEAVWLYNRYVILKPR